MELFLLKFHKKEQRLEGIANYKTFDQQLNTGILSVNGYMKEGVAYIRFRDQKGAVIADGALSTDNGNVILDKQHCLICCLIMQCYTDKYFVKT